MKTDLYTKTVLTVIALCLIIIVFKQVDIVPNVYGDSQKANIKANLNYGLVPLNQDGSVDVNIKSTMSTMDVSIVDISTSDELDVNIDEVGGGYVSYGKLPVVIKENQDKD